MVKSPLRINSNGIMASVAKKSPVKKLRVRSPNVVIKWTNKLINSLLALVLEMAPYRFNENKKIGAQWEEILNRFLNLDE